METRPHKRIHLAQNFLHSPKLVRRLVSLSTIGPSDTVYEIGPGNGIITEALASVARQVVAIEKDPELVRRLRERFRVFANVEIVEQDCLAYVFQSNAVPYKIFANIPYNITAQILRSIVYAQPYLAEACLVLQKEPAKKYSGLPTETLCSILAKPFFEFQILARLKRTDFTPVPNVDSVLLQIKRRCQSLIKSEEVALYREFVEYGFGRWKPNLRLAFKHIFTYKQWKRLSQDLKIAFNAKPTELMFEQWLGLYRGFRSIGGGHR
jgi:16S rRNA A1518/A1519 N6-dimethyltransferase RsmA/KsgA/DIM1 with predicted DNA glycosylase/AP lyase activity